VAPQLVLGQQGDAQTGQSRIHLGRRGVEDQRSGDAHIDLLAATPEIPDIQSTRRRHALIDATMPRQLVGRLRGGVAFEVVGRRHHRHAHRRPDRHRDHVLIDRAAESDPGVEAVGHDVAKAVVHVELQQDVGELVQHRRQFGQEQAVQDVVAAGDPDRTGRLVPELGQRVELGLDFIEAMAYGQHQPFTRRRGRHASGGAGQQPDLQPLFQPLDGLAQRRLSHAQGCARLGEAAFAGHRDECQKIVEIASRHVRPSFSEVY